MYYGCYQLNFFKSLNRKGCQLINRLIFDYNFRPNVMREGCLASLS